MYADADPRRKTDIYQMADGTYTNHLQGRRMNTQIGDNGPERAGYGFTQIGQSGPVADNQLPPFMESSFVTSPDLSNPLKRYPSRPAKEPQPLNYDGGLTPFQRVAQTPWQRALRSQKAPAPTQGYKPRGVTSLTQQAKDDAAREARRRLKLRTHT
jgi:hypothetical protein